MRILKLLAFALGLSALTASAQRVEKCGSMLKMNSDAEYYSYVMQAENEARSWMEKNKTFLKSNADTSYTIPVVVHVIYYNQDSTMNISDSVVYSQIDVLNEDFARLNLDAANTRPIFDSIAADTKIQFELASIDPQGNPTTGITRTATEKQGFDVFSDGMESMKQSSTGGVDAWPTDQYLNIWVCKMTYFGVENALLGFAQFPSTMPESEGGTANYVAETDGVVINYLHFGRTNNPDIAPSNKGRTCTHEVGHWLGLRHIWADEQNPWTGEPGTCSQDDFVDDTPMTNQPSQFVCDPQRNSCDNDAEFSNNYWTNNPPDMVENYMDYSGDDCQNMFTIGQTERMQSFLFTARKRLLVNNVSVEDKYALEGVKVYPNPANSIFTVRVEETMYNTEVVLLNSLGAVVKSTMLNGRQVQLDITDLPNGMYFVKVNATTIKSYPVMVAH